MLKLINHCLLLVFCAAGVVSLIIAMATLAAIVHINPYNVTYVILQGFFNFMQALN